MRQRLGLASALLGAPNVLILDEPTNGLDPEGVHWLRQYLRSFADRGGSVLVSSHLLAEVAQTVDDVVIIANGRLVTQSSLADLAQPSRSGVRVRTPHAETLRAALTAEGIAAELVAADVVKAFETTTEAVGLAAAGAAAVIFEMTAERFDLEELFLELTTSEGALR
jgi:ABC-2 type transport system ATP-binding protein